ncbi:hypothetical protein [Epilithonimonas xixisoli]|uniref:Uncharacterized protein n=1 Tax=Epilithonimonas xixisoli TaxID=1476462 RepID=A0A4R8I8F3_9FLAO|nr:hypothetical protein [Epilithonimonas xixisoli]TDX86318.1 hypothetical protein B0I22_0431 [Epilithonimonas xixisoli]
MTQENKTLSIAEKVKALAMGLIGSFFFTWGLTYFQEQSEYRVPRILIPVFELFGNIGLAIGLLILGLGLMFFAYKKFTEYGGKPIIMLILLPVLVISSFMISKSTQNTDKRTTEEKIESIREKANVQNDKMERPKMDNQKANDFLDKREKLLAEMTKAKNSQDEATFKKLESQFWGLNKDFAKITMEISKDKNYIAFISYSDKITNDVKNLIGK